MSLLGSLQLQDLEAWVELYTLDLTDLGGGLHRFAPDTNRNNQPVVWQGNTFNPWPVKVTGFGADSDGRQFRPKAQVGNGGGVISALMLVYDDLLGAALYRHRTKVKYLDAVNFPPQRNLVTYSEALSLWTLTGVTATQDGTLSALGETEPTWLLSRTNTLAGQGAMRPLDVPTQAIVTTTLWLRAGNSTTADVGMQQAGNWTGRIAAQVVNGPGSVQPGATSLIRVMGLSGKEWTQLEIVTEAALVGELQLHLYPDGADSVEPGAATYVCYPQVEMGGATPYQKVAGAVWNANPTADPEEHLPDDLYYINQVVDENVDLVEFELTSPLELEGLMIPARTIQPDICTLEYRGEGCNYVGGPVADKYDRPTADINFDVCSMTMKGCKLRFPPPAELSFGAWPSAGRVPRG